MFETSGQMFQYVATVRKMDIQADLVEKVIESVKERFKNENPEEWAKYSGLVGCKTSIDEYGFKCWEVRTDHGGTVKIIDFKERTGDMGLYSSMNGYGLGGSNYIRGKDPVETFSKNVNRTVWLNDEEKAFLLEALQTFKVEN